MMPRAFVPKFTSVRDIVQEHERSPIRVTVERARAALALIDMIADDVPAPHISVAIDGRVGLLWDQGDKLLMLIPHTDGRLEYMAEFGRERRQGMEACFLLALPVVITEILTAFRILH